MKNLHLRKLKKNNELANVLPYKNNTSGQLPEVQRKIKPCLTHQDILLHAYSI